MYREAKEFITELTLLLGEPVTLSYDTLQREISRLLFGEEIRTFSVPKWIAKIGSFIENHIPFGPRTVYQTLDDRLCR